MHSSRLFVAFRRSHAIDHWLLVMRLLDRVQLGFHFRRLTSLRPFHQLVHKTLRLAGGVYSPGYFRRLCQDNRGLSTVEAVLVKDYFDRAVVLFVG